MNTSQRALQGLRNFIQACNLTAEEKQWVATMMYSRLVGDCPKCPCKVCTNPNAPTLDDAVYWIFVCAKALIKLGGPVDLLKLHQWHAENASQLFAESWESFWDPPVIQKPFVPFVPLPINSN